MPAISRNIRQAKSTMLRDRQPGDLALLEKDLSLKSRPQMHNRLGQLRLPIAIDAGDADNLSGMYIQAYAAANSLKVNGLYRLNDPGIWGDSTYGTVTGYITNVGGSAATLSASRPPASRRFQSLS